MTEPGQKRGRVFETENKIAWKWKRLLRSIDRERERAREGEGRALSGMDRLMGLLRVKVLRGVNLAYRDARGSDPYVVLRLGRQVLVFLQYDPIPFLSDHSLFFF